MATQPNNNAPIPMWLLAELTYACPLQCPYCSNPVELGKKQDELDTETWKRTLKEARELGAVQLGFSGGEPLVRPDLLELIQYAKSLGFYCNLITSAVGLSEEKVLEFKQAGLNHIQISFQGSEAASNQHFGGSDSFQHKMAMTRAVLAADIPLGLNFVLHRQNIHQVNDFLQVAEDLGAEFVELANCQYYAWALENREALMPSQQQLRDAEAATEAFRQQHQGKMEVFFVAPDYYENRPKKCANGWGTTFITVTPNGEVLPCQSAKVIPGIDFPKVQDHSLKDIWQHSDLFNRFRGTAWMQEPCASCPEKHEDLGGCRCQAMMLTGDASNADPVCDKSAHHHVITAATAAAQAAVNEQPLVFRNPKNAKALSAQTQKELP